MRKLIFSVVTMLTLSSCSKMDTIFSAVELKIQNAISLKSIISQLDEKENMNGKSSIQLFTPKSDTSHTSEKIDIFSEFYKEKLGF